MHLKNLSTNKLIQISYYFALKKIQKLQKLKKKKQKKKLFFCTDRYCLKLASNLGFQNTILEGDLLGLIKALEAEDHNLSPWGLLVEDVKLVANSFVSLAISHIKRNGNSVAHNLAKYAIHIPDFEVWMEDVPSHVISFLHSDVVHL